MQSHGAEVRVQFRMTKLSKMNATPTYRVTSRVLTAAFFAICVLVSGTATLLGYRADIGVDENRKLSKLGLVSGANLLSRKYFRHINAWASDNQALRSPLIAMHAAVKLYGFRSSLNEKTLVGRDGFFFYGMRSMRRDFERKTHFTDNPGYVREVLSYLRGLEAFAAHTGKRILFMAVPNKHNVHPEKYDPRYTFGPGGGTGETIDQWLTKFIPTMALQTSRNLRRSARERYLYYRTDTHWNRWGAMLAARAFADRLERVEPKFRLEPQPDYQNQSFVMDKGGLRRLTGLPLTEMSQQPVPKAGWRAVRNQVLETSLKKKFVPGKPRLFRVFEVSGSSAPTILVLGDSFVAHGDGLPRMMPYIAERFSRSVFYNSFGFDNKPSIRFPQDLVRAVNPDIILVQYAERRIRPCRARRDRARKCAATLIGRLPSNIESLRLRRLEKSGELIAKNLTPRKSGETWVLDLKTLAPRHGKVLVRVRSVGGNRGRIAVLRKRVPRHLRAEQFGTSLKEGQREALMMALATPKRNAVFLTPIGSFDLRTLSFDVIAVPDDTDPEQLTALQVSQRQTTSRTNYD